MEQIFKPFVIILGVGILFASLGLLIITQFQSAAEEVIKGGTEIESNSLFKIMGGYNYTLIDPKDGHSITNDHVRDRMVHPKKSNITFTDPENNDVKYIQIIRNSKHYVPGSTEMWQKYKDFISVQREVDPLLGIGADWNGAAISFDAIARNFDPRTNVSVVHFSLSGKNDTIFIKLASNDTSLLWNNTFTIYYGWSKFRGESIDFWAVITMLVTFQIPGLPDQIQIIVTAFWWVALAFMIFTLASRIIPFIGGG